MAGGCQPTCLPRRGGDTGGTTIKISGNSYTYFIFDFDMNVVTVMTPFRFSYNSTPTRHRCAKLSSIYVLLQTK